MLSIPGSDSATVLSIVIVSWNTRQLVLNCLASIGWQPGVEVILVDNASSDGTANSVASLHPGVIVVRNTENLGFARANNIGIRMSSGRFVCLINSDVEVPDGCLDKMLDFMRQHTDVGMLGPKMILRDGRVGQSCQRFPTVWNWFCRALALDSMFPGSKVTGDFLMTRFKYDRTADVDALTGWFWMLRREALDEVGLLDERFFMYGEDIDWPKRFHAKKWRVVFYHEASALHLCGASSSLAPSRFYVEMNRANMQYFLLHHGKLAVAGFWAAMWLHEIVRIAGYGVVCLFLGERMRKDAARKINRSFACLMWLFGVKRGNSIESV